MEAERKSMGRRGREKEGREIRGTVTGKKEAGEGRTRMKGRCREGRGAKGEGYRKRKERREMNGKRGGKKEKEGKGKKSE